LKRHRAALIVAVTLFLLTSLVVGMLLFARPSTFDGQNALKYVAYQMALGPRTPSSQAHKEIIDWLVSQLRQYGWQVEVQDLEYQGHRIQNVIAKRGSSGRWIILGAHYDSRMSADQDPDPALQAQAVPGANDGASGVAVLMEIARVYRPQPDVQAWLVFFDAEDQGHLPGWDWILGSRAFVEYLQGTPEQVIILDMVGDADQDIYFESNSDATLNAQVWQVAAALGYGQTFIPEQKYSMLDDHTPFLEKGITAIDIIDFDYPYWHTTSDTVDKISAQSLQRIGDTILEWLKSAE
jgi:glutaminyl-peptide cyclotransferase